MQSERRQTQPNVVLIGFMGTGKTSTGRMIARSLEFDFVDTDALIVETAGKPIPDIFDEVGEPGFRAIESRVLASLGERKRCVVSTGGGVVTVPENIEVLRGLGFVVWLDTPSEVIYQRVSGNDERPLLQTDNPLKTIEDMLEGRRPLYESACDQRVATKGLERDEIAYGVAESARVWFGNDV